VSRRKLALIVFCALIVIFGAWMLSRTHSSAQAPTTVSGVSEPTCPMATLPPEVVDTVRRIRTGGPFPFPHNDGAVLVNREGHVPKQCN
jgi:ribonuclease T1